ncbi:MAG: efflux RND transporter periplasmic adaptor subunit [Rhodospirillales bacterium]|nr:efflux RND transporter periplasmic adaptor subunit [Rhodospirillales bacterium]
MSSPTISIDAAARRKRMFGQLSSKTRLTAAVLGLSALVLAVWLGVRQGAGGDGQQWVTARASRGDLEDTTTALGTFQPRDFVDVGTQVSGQLRRIFVEIGDTVTQGQLLAEIDPTIYAARVDADRAQLQSLRAQLTEKQAQFALAKEQYDRQTRMRRAQATSEEAFQTAETAWKTTQAQIAQLRAQIQQVESNLRADEANLGYTRIYAPMAGTVVSQPARQGQTLNATQLAPVIVRVADLSTMTVWTQVSEAVVNKLRIGQDVYFTTLGQPDRRWYSNLRQILPTPEIINNVVLYDALFDVPNPDGTLGIQMSAQVFFIHDSVKDAILIPAAALAVAEARERAAAKGPRKAKDRGAGAESGDKNVATILVMKNGKPEPRTVTTGVKNRVQVQIVSGLEAGEEVVIGSRRLDGARAGAAKQSQPGTPMVRPRI